ncbi:MAG: prephenate dehydratase [Candidatus Marinimicrobia bacterium]|nr:prephenate dehydratase [Candidatus Neomarinimicrobiota bacterium]
MSQPETTAVAIQGIEGSFSEEAAIEFCRRHGIEAPQWLYRVTSENVLKSLDDDTATFGILALENAQGGVVIESIEALARYRCRIVEMFHIHVEQCLLARPDAQLGDVTEIHSHQQAIRQCRDFLAEHFQGRTLVETADTALAARQLAEGQLPAGAAVIGSRRCADIYQLQVLQENIQDLKNNLTLFLGVQKWAQ